MSWNWASQKLLQPYIFVSQIIHVIVHGFKQGNLQAASEDYKIRMFNKARKSLCTLHLVWSRQQKRAHERK